MSRIEEIRKSICATRRNKEKFSGQVTQSILDKEYLLSEVDRLRAERDAAMKLSDLYKQAVSECAQTGLSAKDALDIICSDYAKDYIKRNGLEAQNE